MASVSAYRDLGEAAWAWVASQVADNDGPWLPASVSEDQQDLGPPGDRDSLYAGIAGLAPVLAEIALHRAHSDVELVLVTRIVARLRAQAMVRVEPSLSDGLAGDVTALKLLEPGSELVALGRLVELMTPVGWNTTLDVATGSNAPLTDIICGSAGIVLAAVWAGGEHAEAIAVTGGECLMRVAERTEGGLDWGMWPGATSRMPNYSHGTAGVATALAIAGAALRRPDFVRAACRGAEHLLTVGRLDDGGFVIPHTIPPSTREVEPVTYSWCHGPTGTSYLFAALAHAGVAEVGGRDVAELRRRCLHSILTSGVPQRLRPGFWDNDGRCCGTAGVGDALLDAAQDCPDPAHAAELVDAARRMGDALIERAIRDDAVWDGDVHAAFVEYLDRGEVFEHIASFWPLRHRDNVLFVHYNDLTADLAAEMRRVAAFLDIDIRDDAWDDVVQRCTFASMRARGDEIGPFEIMFEGGIEGFLHKGTNGRWRDVLTTAELSEYDQRATDLLPAEARDWLHPQ